MASNLSWHDWVAAGVPDLFSILIPARNEAKNLKVVVPALLTALESAGINHEILVVNDVSTDDTRDVLVAFAATSMCALSKIHRRIDLGSPYAPVWRNFAGMPLPRDG